MNIAPLSSNVLLVTAVPLLNANGRLMLDDQTCEGLSRWAENFERVTYVGIAADERSAEGAKLIESTVAWRDVRDLPFAHRVEFTGLPASYRMLSFARSYRRVRRTLALKIRESRYLCFTLGALVGDWGGVASLEAISQGRRYAVSFDRIEYEVIRNTLGTMSPQRRLKERVSLPWMARYHQYLTRRSSLGLFQGEDCFQALAPFAPRPFIVYDTHTQSCDRIGPEMLQAKCFRVCLEAPLKIAYAGRAAEMKGPMEWLRVISEVRKSGVALSAVWLGDGPLLQEMRREADRLAISDCVTFPGFVADRAMLLSTLRDTDLFMFCHKTPESPRCLVESLVSGTPIVGFDSHYPRGLIKKHGGGRLVEAGNVGELAALITQLATDRSALADLILRSAREGEQFDEESVYRQRSELLKTFL